MKRFYLMGFMLTILGLFSCSDQSQGAETNVGATSNDIVTVPEVSVFDANSAIENSEAESMPATATETSKSSEMLVAKVDVSEVLHAFSHMWEFEDMSFFPLVVANDPNVIVIGTDAGEQIVGYDNFMAARIRQFDAFQNVEYSVDSQVVNVSESGTVAWFSQEVALLLKSGEEVISIDGLRITGVLEKRSAGWQIVQLHNSVPVQGQVAEY